jgi:hypothetical protein
MLGIRFNLPLFLSGIVVVALIGMASHGTHPGARLGERFQLNTALKGFHRPKSVLENIGCCVDEIESASWSGSVLQLDERRGAIKLQLTARGQAKDPRLPNRLQADVLSAVPYQGSIFVGETQERRLLQISSNGAASTVLGSNQVGGIHGLQLDPCTPDPPTLLMSTGPRVRSGEYLLESAPSEDDRVYLRRTRFSDPKVIAWSKDGLQTLKTGEALWAPSGLAVTPDGQDLFVADEHENELVWLRLHRSLPCPNAVWSPQGRFARFHLRKNEKNLFRGLVVVPDPGIAAGWFLVGSGPGGLFFFASDGHLLGKIETGLEISYILIGHPRSEKGTNAKALLYAVAGSALWKLQL